MLASTQSSSLVSQEIYTTSSNSTTSASSSNSTTNGESSVNSNNNLSECLTASSSTTPPSYFLLYYWTILYTYITNIFSKSTARLRRHSTGEHAYMAQASVSADTNNNINNNTNNNNSPQQPLRRSPRFKPKKQLQQQISSSSIDSISPLKAANSSIRLRNNAKQVHQSSMTSTPSFSSMMKTKTLILDLDETLIHSTSRGSRADAHMIEVMVDNHACLYYVYKRPHVDHFLKKVSEWYKVVIFTASMPEYADPVIDWLDPNKNLICNRFFRQSCTNRNGAYIKDLTIVEPDLSKVCLVDNSPISYAMHQENGIAIEGWINDPHDEALLDLLPFLDALRFTEDVRSILSLATY